MIRLVVLLVLMSSSVTFAQDDSWRDSLIVARKAYANKEYAKALKYYESAQKKAPDDIDLSDEMAQSAYRAREFDRAEKIYKQGSGSKMNKRDRGDAMHNLGNSQMRQKNYEGAIESYKEALRNNPKDEETRYNLSEALRKLKDKQNPPPPKPNDSKNNDSDQGNSGQNGQPKSGQSEKDKKSGQDGKEPKDKNGQSGPSSSKPGANKSGSGPEGNDEGKLSNQMVERALDDIAKKEGETKRQMMGAGNGGRSAKSGKDW